MRVDDRVLNVPGVLAPIVAKAFPLAGAANALRCLVESRPFGRVVFTV
jgi:hypothetical protein